MTFDTLVRRVWAKREKGDANLVRTFVRNLRRKLGDSAASPPAFSTSTASAPAWRDERNVRGSVACQATLKTDSENGGSRWLPDRLTHPLIETVRIVRAGRSGGLTQSRLTGTRATSTTGVGRWQCRAWGRGASSSARGPRAASRWAFKADALWVGAASEQLDGAARRLNASGGRGDAGAHRARGLAGLHLGRAVIADTERRDRVAAGRRRRRDRGRHGHRRRARLHGHRDGAVVGLAGPHTDRAPDRRVHGQGDVALAGAGPVAVGSTPRSATGCRWLCASSGRPGSAIRPHSTAGTSGWATCSGCSGCWAAPEPTVRARHRRAAAREPAGGRRQQGAALPGEHRVVTGSRKHVARGSSTRRTQHGGSAEASGTAGRGQGPARSRIRRMGPDATWIIATVITVGGALAAFMYALVNGVHKSIDGVHKRFDDVRTDPGRLHDDHKLLEDRLRAAGG